MIVSANQPYFAPFAGFFYKAARSDIFVLLDEVQFPRGTTWMTRNRFKNDQGTLWMTIPVWKKGLGLQKINAVRICHEGRWSLKYIDSLKVAYANAPYFADHLAFIETVFASRFERLIDLNLEIIKHLMRSLNIRTKILLQSQLDTHSKGNRLIAEICHQTEASCYLVQSSAQKYLQPERFQGEHLHIEYVMPPKLIYPQLWGNFISNLSAFDLIFNCGPKAHDLIRAAI